MIIHNDTAVAAPALKPSCTAQRTGVELGDRAAPVPQVVNGQTVPRRRSATRSFIFLLLAVVTGLAGADAPEKLANKARFDALMNALSAPMQVRRTFVENNFAESALKRRGVDELTDFLGHVHENLGPAPPKSVQVFDDRVEARFASPVGDDTMLFTLLLSAPPESKINGFTIGPDQSEPAVSTGASDLPAAIASLMDKQAGDGFSGAVIVAKDGKPIFSKAFGEADRTSHRANTLDTPFNLASANKMFTALVVAKLVEQGKLDWNDHVGKFLPDWPQPTVRDKVTIAHLLSHTSGLGDYWGPQHDARRSELRSVEQYADLIRNDSAAPNPGASFHYSNNGFVLLGLIAQKASGKDYFDLVREFVYKPAGMPHSDHFERMDEKSARAIGYDKDGNANTDQLAARGSPAGGGYASANDLLKFANALTAGKIVATATLQRMTTRHAQMGPDGGYGYGFGVFDDKEHHYGHNGGAPGVKAAFEVFPDSGYVVIVLSNSDSVTAHTEQQIGRMILSRK